MIIILILIISKRTILSHEIEKNYIDNFNAMNNQKHIEFEHS